LPIIQKYIDRADVGESFESSLQELLKSKPAALLGLPGVGKSITSRAIAARYSENEVPAIILSIQRKVEEFTSLIEIIELDNRYFPIPVISVPSHSTDPEGLLKSIAASIDDLYRRTKDLPKLIERFKAGTDSAETVGKILKDTISSISSQSQTFLPFIDIVAEVVPYASTLLKIADYLLKKRDDKRIASLGKKEILIVVDDLKDLEPNWNVLSKLLNYNYHFLFVLRVEDSNEYLDLSKDKTHLNRYLQNKVGIHVEVIEKRFLSPPKRQIFQAIMISHSVTADVISDLWLYSGGITATALMMWYAAGKDGLKEFVKKVKDNILVHKIELSWATEDVAKRLTYTYYSAKEIYNTLKSTSTLKFKKNYAYVALVAQPDGVSIDELLLFCGCSFGIVHPFDNQYVQKVVKVFEDGSCCPDSRKIDVRPNAPYTGNEDCSHILDMSIVDEYVENWNIGMGIKSGEMKNEPAPSISGGKGKRMIYKFNRLFGHLPLILQEVEKYDQELQYDMEQARKILLNILNQEAKITGTYSDGIMDSAYQHILRIRDVSKVEWAVVNFLTQKIIGFPLIDLQILSATQRKFFEAAKTNELYQATMYHVLAIIAKRHQLLDKAQWIINKIIHNPLPTDRVALMDYAYILTHISPLFGFDKIGDEAQCKSEQIVNELCEQQDSLCLFAKLYVYSECSEYYFSRTNYSRLKCLLDEATVALEKLKDSYYTNEDDLDWLKNSKNVHPSLELFLQEKSLNSKRATLFYYSDSVREAAMEYQKIAKSEEEVRVYDGSLRNFDQELVCGIMGSKDDGSFEDALIRMAAVDMKILEWLKLTEVDNISKISTETIAMLHTHAAFASIAHGIIYEKHDLLASYQKSQIKHIDKELLFYPHFEALYFCGLEVLESIMKGSCNIGKFIMRTLEYSKSIVTQSEKSKLLLALHSMVQYDKAFMTLELEGSVEEVSREKLEKYLTDQLDTGFSLDFCKTAFRDKLYSSENLIAEWVCSILSRIQLTYANTLMIGLFLIYKKYDILINILHEYLQSSENGLLSRLFIDFINAVNSMRAANTETEKQLARKKLAKAYVTIWFY